LLGQPLALGQEIRAAIVVRGHPVLPTILRGVVRVWPPVAIAIVAVLVTPILPNRLAVVAILVANPRRVIVSVAFVMHVPEPRWRRFVIIELIVGPRRMHHWRHRLSDLHGWQAYGRLRPTPPHSRRRDAEDT
jgi:hypothetical protein